MRLTIEIKDSSGNAVKVAKVADFSATAGRKRPQIENAILRGELDAGVVLGLKVVILNDKSKKYLDLCKNRDRLKK